MKHLKVSELLKSFSARELNDCRKYLSSHYLNENTDVLKLYEWLIQFSPGFDAAELTKQHIFRLLFGNKKFNDLKVRHALSDLTSKLESYLAFAAFYSDKNVQQQLLRKELAKRECSKNYSSIKYKPSQPVPRNTEYYTDHFKDAFIHLYYWQGKQNRTNVAEVENTAQSLNQLFLSGKLQLCCELINSNVAGSDDPEQSSIKAIEKIVSETNLDNEPFINIYYCILQMLLYPAVEEHYRRLIQLLHDNNNEFAPGDMREMYQYAMNYCIRKINNGNANYLQLLFEIYETILQNKIIFYDGYLSQWDYKNIVSLSLRLGHVQWASAFIRDGSKDLRSEEKDNAVNFNLAYWNFSQQNFSKARTLLQKVTFTDLVYQLDARSILLKVYFEEENTEAFFYHAEAFRVFLNRNKQISPNQQKLYKNLIRYTSQILKAGFKKSRLQEINASIEKNPQVADVKWLKEKINELI